MVKNTQEPQWNHNAEFKVPDGNSRTFNVEVFDVDKIGKDKSLGKLALDITDVLSMDGEEDFLDDLIRKASDIFAKSLTGGDPNDPYGLAGNKKK